MRLLHLDKQISIGQSGQSTRFLGSRQEPEKISTGNRYINPK